MEIVCIQRLAIQKSVSWISFLAKTQGIKRQDVVVVYNEETDENWVKRVIGMPNDTVYAKDDVVYVNDKPLEEPYLNTEYANHIRSQGNHYGGI